MCWDCNFICVTLEFFLDSNLSVMSVCISFGTQSRMDTDSETLVKAPRNSNVFPSVLIYFHNRSKSKTEENCFCLAKHGEMIIVVVNKGHLRSLYVQRVLLVLCG